MLLEGQAQAWLVRDRANVAGFDLRSGELICLLSVAWLAILVAAAGRGSSDKGYGFWLDTTMQYADGYLGRTTMVTGSSIFYRCISSVVQAIMLIFLTTLSVYIYFVAASGFRAWIGSFYAAFFFGSLFMIGAISGCLVLRIPSKPKLWTAVLTMSVVNVALSVAFAQSILDGPSVDERDRYSEALLSSSIGTAIMYSVALALVLVVMEVVRRRLGQKTTSHTKEGSE